MRLRRNAVARIPELIGSIFFAQAFPVPVLLAEEFELALFMVWPLKRKSPECHVALIDAQSW